MHFIFLFHVVVIKALFGNKWSRIALKKILFDFSYRLPVSLKGKLKSVFVFTKASLKLLWNSKNELQNFPSSGVVFYDCYHTTDKASKDYFRCIFCNPPEFGVFRDSLPNNLLVIEKIFISLFLIANLCCSLFLMLFYKNFNLAVVGTELVENAILFKFLTKNKINKVLILSSFERDITLLCYILRMLNIKAELFPSPNPLKLFYKYVYADKLWLSAPFQLLEAKKMSVNWSVKEYGQIPPYDFQLINKFKNGLIYPYKLGITSSGMGFRKKQGIELGDENEYQAEVKLQKTIKRLIESGKINKNEFVIFLHPKEKNKKDEAQVLEYYKSIFGFEVNFGPLDKPTNQCFNLCELAIATISASQIERLFGGYKSVFAPLSVLRKPFSDERLDGISANTEEELFLLIENVLSKTEEEFFNDYNLKDYHYNKFPNLPMYMEDSVAV